MAELDLRAGQSDRRARAGVIPRNVKVLSWVSFFQDAASELLYPIMPLFLTVTLGASTAVVGLVEGVAEGTAAVGKAVSGPLADRMRRKPLIAAGYGISSVAKPAIGLRRMAARARCAVGRPGRQGRADLSARRAHRR